MSKLEELIQELCPNGVEHKMLQEVCRFQNGFSFKSTLFKDEGEPILRITNIKEGRLSDDSYVYFDLEDYNENLNAYKVKKGDVVVAMSGATTGKIGYNYSNKEYYLNQRVGLFVPNENILLKRFLYHWLTMQTKNIYNISSGSGTQPNLSSIKMMKMVIPVPPLEVQCEIVRILDKFTLLTAELTAELTARRKQYEYYRNLLVSFNNFIQKRKFGNIASIQRGASPRPISQFITNDMDGVNWIKIGDVDKESKYIIKSKEKITIDGSKKSRKVKKGDFILSNSMSFGRPYILAIDGCIHDGWLSISDFEDVFISDFLYYLLNSNDIQNEFRKKASFGGAVQNLNADIVRGIELHIPSKDKQQKIINILDRFDELCNDITNGLPAEIELNNKRYEYYRDKLLTFKEKNNE